MVHRGSCHCGRIAFEVEGDIHQVIECLPEFDRSHLKVVPYDGRSK